MGIAVIALMILVVIAIIAIPILIRVFGEAARRNPNRPARVTRSRAGSDLRSRQRIT